MNDDSSRSPDPRPTETQPSEDARAEDASTPDSSPFEQLALGATVTGPGMRTEDHYERGARLKIKGERGVFVYKHASVSREGLVSLHLMGADGARAVRPERVAPIRKRRTLRHPT